MDNSFSYKTIIFIVEIQGIPIEVEIRGEGLPILLIHGWSADRRYMIADLEPIFLSEKGWRRIYFDLPGHGSTPAPKWLSTQDQMLNILHELINVLFPNEKFAVAGNSYGGFLTLALIRSMPNQLTGAALLVPDLPDRLDKRIVPEPVTIHKDSSIFFDLKPNEAWIPTSLPVHERRMLEEIRRYDMPAYHKADLSFLSRLEKNYILKGKAGYPSCIFEKPSLILTGRQDSRVGYQRAIMLIEEMPRATFSIIDLAGHHLGRIERPILFKSLVTDWLKRLQL